MVFNAVATYAMNKLAVIREALSLEPRRIVSEDRQLLEDIILPSIGADPRYRKILFVGCSAYTQWYDNFFSKKEYWTIERKYHKRKYGSRNHITDSIENLRNHFQRCYFHVIIMNGVIGFGLDRVDDIDRAIATCFETLARGGVLILGWNDDRTRMPIPLSAIRALDTFHEYAFEPLHTCHLRVEGRYHHTFSFYRKP